MARILTLVMIATISMATLSDTWADEAESLFDQIYKEKVKQAKNTVDKADDVSLARTMIELARESTGEPKLLILLCNAVVDLTARTLEGRDLAIEALKLQHVHVPGSRPATRAAMIEIYGRQLTLTTSTAEQKDAAGEALISLHVESADEKLAKADVSAALIEIRQALSAASRVGSPRTADLKLRMEMAEHRQRVEQRVMVLRERLLANANDTAAADECVTLLLVELDDSRKAESLLTQAADATLKRLVPLAAKPIENLTAADSLALGEWYMQMANKAAAPLKERVYIRAEAWLRHFLSLYSDNDLKRKRVELLAKEASMAASKAFFAQSPPPKGLVLLYSFDEDSVVERSGKRYVVDDSGGKNDMLVKDHRFEAGLSGAAMYVARPQDGASSMKAVGIRAADARTLSVWIKGENPSMDSEHWPFIGWGEDGEACQFHIGMYRGGYQLWSWGFGQDWMPGLRRVKDDWEHIAVTYDGEALRWHHNGKLYGPHRHVYRTIDTPLRLTHGIGGWIDEMAVYNRALSPAEVVYLFNHSKRGLRYGYAK